MATQKEMLAEAYNALLVVVGAFGILDIPENLEKESRNTIETRRHGKISISHRDEFANYQDPANQEISSGKSMEGVNISKVRK